MNKIREGTTPPKKVTIEGPLLEGHLNLTVELIQYQSHERKISLGSTEQENLIIILLKEFIMPASYMMRQLRDEEFELDPDEEVAPICTSQVSRI